MLDKGKLLQFLLQARVKTYAGGGGKTEAVLSGSIQLEYQKSDWFYRDVYYNGKGVFMGLEAVYYQSKPVWTMSYYGSCKGAPEKQVYKFLKEALLAKWKTARIWKRVEWKRGDYKYICEPDFEGSVKELAGVEKIFKGSQEIYTFYYAGALLKEKL